MFTASQYASKYNRPEFVQFLSKIFNIPDVVILFLGYGLNEYELIDYLITKTESSDKCFKYILEGFYSGQEVVCHARSHYLESLGVHLIPYCLDSKSFLLLMNKRSIGFGLLSPREMTQTLFRVEPSLLAALTPLFRKLQNGSLIPKKVCKGFEPLQIAWIIPCPPPYFDIY